MSASNDVKMNSEAPFNGSPLHDDSENDKKLTSSLDQENGVTSPSSTEMDESNVTSTEKYKVWVLDDIESLIVEFVEDIAMGSAGQSMENVVNRRLFGCIAAWGAAIIQETLVSAIAPTGDTCVDTCNSAILNNSRAFLGRGDIALESLDPPKSCPIDDTYQRRQIPIRIAKRDHYDSEGLHHAVKAATRSHTHPASVTSSRMTMKSKVRRKQNGAPSVVEVTGPQPGVPFSTEVRDGKTSSWNYTISPRKAIAQHRTLENVGQATSHIDNTPPSPTEAGLQLNLDLESASPNNGVATSRTRRSPPPLSKSPSSVTSSRRRPHPPGSAQSSRAVKTFCFGEREEEVKVEFAVQKSPPLRSTVSTRGVLPDIDGGRMKPRPNLSYQAFGAFSNFKDGIGDPGQEAESLFDEDQLDQRFQAMSLSPGVKVRTGEEANAGPDLPLFASRMRRSTFVRMETCTLPTPNSDPLNQHQVQQPGKGTFLTETAWDFGLASAPKNFVGDQKTGHGRNRHFDGGWNGSKSDDLSYAETTASCSCGSSTSLTLFRRPSKVQRPCRACGNTNSESTRTDAINFTSVVKQRAFHMKPPCLPTSSSPSKRAPGASPRRVTSAPPACSPLARRSLMLSKKAPLPRNRDLDSPTKIL